VVGFVGDSHARDPDIGTESWLYDMKLICQSILSIQPLIRIL
jgi:hypothetical protein